MLVTSHPGPQKWRSKNDGNTGVLVLGHKSMMVVTLQDHSGILNGMYHAAKLQYTLAVQLSKAPSGSLCLDKAMLIQGHNHHSSCISL